MLNKRNFPLFELVSTSIMASSQHCTSDSADIASLPNQTDLPVVSNSCILLDNIPLEWSQDEVSRALLPNIPGGTGAVSDVKVVPHPTGSPTVSPSKNYAIASVTGSRIEPTKVHLQTGLLSPCLMRPLFEEKATAEFILNRNCITAQLGNILYTEAKTLSVQIMLAEGNKLVISGTCSQIYKFRQYMTAILTQNMLSLPSQPQVQVHVDNSGAVNTVTTADQVPQGKSFTGLSPDVLLLMPQLAEGRFKGMVFYPEEGRVEVLPSSEEEQEKCISKFQTTYQSIIKNRQLKSGNLEVPPLFPTENLLELIEEFNNKFSQCNFSFNEQTQSIRIVSISSRQFDQANKLISDKLKGTSFEANKSKPVKLPTKTGSFQIMSLGNNRILTVKRSDIVSENVDIIVNAANEQLDHMAGVAGALNKASKGELQKHSKVFIKQKGFVPVGGVAITQAGGNLKCKQVIHAVGPIASPFVPDQKCSELLHQAVTNTLIEAQKLKASSISLPAISTGVFSVKKELAAEAILNAILTFNFTSDQLKDIRIVIIDEPTYVCFAQHLITKREFVEANQLTQSSHNDSSNNGFKVGDMNLAPATFPPPGFNPAPAGVVTSQPTGGLTISPQPTTSTNIHYPDLSTALTQTNTVLSNHGNQLTATTQGNSNFPDLNQLKLVYEQSGSGAVGGLVARTVHGVTDQLKLSGGRGSQLLPNQMTLPNASIKKTIDNNSNGASPGEDGRNGDSSHVRTPTPDQDQPKGATGGSDKEGCPICLNEVMTAPVETKCCKQKFCQSCLDEALKHSCYCPMCKVALKTIRGNQPPGQMTHTVINQKLPGYEGHGCIVITYHIPSGTQGPEHPNPGQRYQGTSRTAYLPNCPEGREVLELLKKAFDAGLIFTVGTSHTTHTPNSVVWNDIHHKTVTRGQPFGYPDPNYLKRVKEELRAKGIQ